ncbi:MAG: hypothetical protein ACK5MN_13735 [Lachnospiraceae bacterium]
MRIQTHYGELLPRDEEEIDARTRNRKSVAYYASGALKSVYLKEASYIDSPLGRTEAEFVTFYESGELRRLFPLFGKVSGYWSEEDEIALAKVMCIELPFARLAHKISCVSFYKSGNIKSISFYKDEVFSFRAGKKELYGRIGLALYEDGSVRSAEPAFPQLLSTKYGMLEVYDNQPLAIHGDRNSLQFAPDHTLLAAKSAATGVRLHKAGLPVEEVIPEIRPSLLDLDQTVVAAITVELIAGGIRVTDSDNAVREYLEAEYEITFFKNRAYTPSADCGDCSNCVSGCYTAGRGIHKSAS